MGKVHFLNKIFNDEEKMRIKHNYTKLISLILIISIINLIGCYSSEAVTLREYRKIEEEKGKPEKIYVLKGSNEEYHFAKSGYTIENDTLYGRGLKVVNHEKQPFEGKIPITDITSIELSEFDAGTTVLVILGIAALVFAIYAASSMSNMDIFNE
jgi:hypothetical protein